MAEQLVQVKGASKRFGDKEALRSVSFAVPFGEICWETLSLSAAMHGVADRTMRDELGPLIERLRLGSELDGYAEDFSRGTKKKLALLLALLHRPRLLVLDEPTNGLDVEATQVFHELMREQAAGGGPTSCSPST